MAYRLILADDEYIICDMLEKIIRFEELNLELVGKAHTGDQLLSLIKQEKPDIVITDINMPTMNGIEVIRRVREMGSDCHFIVVSGYNEFDYVYSALKYDVKDYLLKPIPEDELNNTLKKCVALLDQSERVKPDNSEMSRRYFIFSGIRNLRNSQDTLEEINQIFFTRLKAACFRGLQIRVGFSQVCDSMPETVSFLNRKLEERVRAVFSDACYDLICGGKRCGMRVLLNYDPSRENDIQTKIEVLQNEFDDVLANYSGISYTICVSKMKNDWRALAELFEEAEIAEWCRLIYSGKKTIRFNDAMEQPGSAVTIKLNLLRTRLENAFEICSINDFEACGREIFALQPDALATKQVRELVQSIPEALFRFCGTALSNVQSNDLAKSELNNLLELANTIESYRDILLSNISRMMEKAVQEIDNQHLRPVRLALKYIEENYDRTLFIEEVSNYVGLSPVYFSTLFKKETGMTFTDYMTEFHINKAKELLVTTNLNVQEIAYKLGFSDSHYFSRLFKKNVGVKPTEYRRICG